jgi:hypothetical protein
MNRILVRIVVLQLLLASTSFNRPVAALEPDKNSGQIHGMKGELSQEHPGQQNMIRVTDGRKAHLRDQRRTLTRLQQSDLLHKLIAADDVRRESGRITTNISNNSAEQDLRLLDELLVGTAIP